MLDSNASDVATARRTLTQQKIECASPTVGCYLQNHSMTAGLTASLISDAQLLVFKVQLELGKVPDTDETRNDLRRLQAREVRLLRREVRSL